MRVLFARDGRRLDLPYDINLWEVSEAETTRAATVVAPLDPADYGIDPLMLM